MKRSIFILLVIVIFAGCSMAESNRVRQSTLAGSWYPAGKEKLLKMVSQFFDAADKVKVDGTVRGLISPHAGYAYSGKAAAAGYSLIKGKPIKRVIILAPSHRMPLRGASIMDVDYYQTPLGDVPLDVDSCRELQKNDLISSKDRVHRQEHSIEIQLPLLQYALEDFKIIPILMGELKSDEFETLANLLKPFVDKNTLVVASSDFIHQGWRFGYTPYKTDQRKKIPELDHKAFSYIKNLDQPGFINFVNETGATICGKNPIGVLILLMKNTEAKEIDYYTSADLTGDWDNSVSYFSIAFLNSDKNSSNPEKKNNPGHKNEKKEDKGDMSLELTASEKDTALKLARDTLNLWVKEKRLPENVEKKYEITDRLKQKRGVFVTLKSHGNLRGCIGYVTGRAPVYRAIMDNAVNASTNDPRFPAVEEEELKGIDIEISVMTPLTEVESIDEIEVGVHGLVMKRGYRSGLLLPQVPVEWNWDRDEFLEHTCRKAGLERECWKNPETTILKFSAQVFGEKED